MINGQWSTCNTIEKQCYKNAKAVLNYFIHLHSESINTQIYE